MESTIKIEWRGKREKIIRAINSIKPDDPESFSVEFMEENELVTAIVTVTGKTLSSAKTTADDILACLSAASLTSDLI
ncbi:MAG: hypothetical protein CMB42_02440 [Euryarchaeota archaeon]|nr:hypothetical protein [Euryarchaeota archaeon]|tara:strand:- start:35880 stop:36113 length:234 start_codon:yes stop_codon:yes gene_type:complete